MYNTKIGTEIASSPMNYIGGKSKILPQIQPIFPRNIDGFHDVFSGGGNVGVNIKNKKLFLNDLNNFVMQILEEFYTRPIDDILLEIQFYIEKYNLSKTNVQGFLNCRTDYNKKQNPIQLYTLICYSFNYQFRFNSLHEYNNPFGKERSHFSGKLREKLIRFITKIKMNKVEFSNLTFQEYFSNKKIKENDFLYCDPPYLITTGSYNDGHRGFKHWDIYQEKDLLNALDFLNNKNIKFALSNVLYHKGKENNLLIEWSKKYKIHEIHKNYKNSCYNTSRGDSLEVVITNY